MDENDVVGAATGGIESGWIPCPKCGEANKLICSCIPPPRRGNFRRLVRNLRTAQERLADRDSEWLEKLIAVREGDLEALAWLRDRDVAEGAQRCRECGCTSNFGCRQGCGWIEADLCSECAGRRLEELTDPFGVGGILRL